MLLRFIFQYLIFSSENITETVTVIENGCSKLFFDVLRLVRECLFGYFCFFQSNDSYSNAFAVKILIRQYFTVKVNRNHHSSQNWVC